MNKGKAKGFRVDEHETLWFEDRVYVPNNAEIRKLILQEAHDSPYSIHPGNTKMYLDLKERFWWTGMKKDIAEYVQYVMYARERKQNNRSQPDYYSLYRYPNGSGINLAWISSPDYPGHDPVTIPSG